MASKKISDLPFLSDLDYHSDLVMLVDTSDTRFSPSGTNKKATVSDVVQRHFHINLVDDSDLVEDVSYSFFPPFNAVLKSVHLSLATPSSHELRLHVDYSPSHRFTITIPPLTDRFSEFFNLPFSSDNKVVISLISNFSEAKGLKMDMIFR